MKQQSSQLKVKFASGPDWIWRLCTWLWRLCTLCFYWRSNTEWESLPDCFM